MFYKNITQLIVITTIGQLYWITNVFALPAFNQSLGRFNSVVPTVAISKDTVITHSVSEPNTSLCQVIDGIARCIQQKVANSAPRFASGAVFPLATVAATAMFADPTGLSAVAIGSGIAALTSSKIEKEIKQQIDNHQKKHPILPALPPRTLIPILSN
ncbi:hypothetical protein BDF19DRAFT_440123 [Syncephalis fuscata]|nr:hypothetical protein BDF19DRAFT_440123 [Syncephalis fuscata]